MEILEKELENIIFEAAQSEYGRNFLMKRGLYVSGKLYRQLNLGEYGIADLVSIEYIKRGMHQSEGEPERMYRTIGVTIYELKKGSIGANAMMQAHRYAAGVRQHFLDKFKRKDGKKVRLKLQTRIFLIGDDIDSGDFVYTLEDNKNVTAFTYEFNYEGIWFNHIHDGYQPERESNKALIENFHIDLREFVSTRSTSDYANYLEDQL